MIRKIRPIPAFDDNYIWVLRHPDWSDVTLVDPGDPEPVLEYLAKEGLTLSSILITHHHWDHVGGVTDLQVEFPDVRVYGPPDPRIAGITQEVRDGDPLDLGDLGRLQVLDLPGHTSTHVGYLGSGVLFCGDTLFAAGCGRVFDGTFPQLSASLERIAALPPATWLYCAHEYTLANLGFARWVEPDNQEIVKREERERQRRALGEPTVPSVLAEELPTNPFLRTQEPQVIAAAEQYAGRALPDRAQVFQALRQWKDRQYD